MRTDIEINQNTVLDHIKNIAAKLDITEDDLEYYGKYKAKLSNTLWNKIKNNKNGKLILVTSTNPTQFGEGKTTTSIGLIDAFAKLGYRVCGALREPSLGPTFGKKGGATGGLYSQIAPMADINLHFTGDIHAITTAHNLIAATIDNHIHQGNQLNIDICKITWNRVVDLNDRALRNIVIGLGGKANGVTRETGFDITVASEIMAICALSNNLEDLYERLNKIIVAYNINDKPITVKDLNITGSLVLLLKDALKPNLVQTLEHNPCLVHCGPFANIAHGCNSIIATKYALKLADYVITEAGFGSDLGAEKFLNIKCRMNGIQPDCIVIVTTIRALKLHGGVDKNHLIDVDTNALRAGLLNLEKHIDNMLSFNIPVVVLLNKFDTDVDEEIFLVKNLCLAKHVDFNISSAALQGSSGGLEAAKTIINNLNTPSKIQFTYNDNDSIDEKIYKIATNIYGAVGVKYSKAALKQLDKFKNFNNLPVCIAKTQYSLSDDASLLGCPENFYITVRELKINAGADFIVAICGDIMLMPGLPTIPAAEKININVQTGNISGLF